MAICGVAAASVARADAPAPAYAWVQYGNQGQPEIRAIPAGAACPDVVIDGVPRAMALRIPAAKNFDRILCIAPYSAAAASASVGGFALPHLPRTIARIAVIGDTKAATFADIARSIAREKPDLIIHLGNYGPNDAESWNAWNADVFAPAASLFAIAPIVFVRGSGEACAYAGVGWSRYLAADPSQQCVDHDGLTQIALPDLQLVNVDSAGADERTSDQSAFQADETIADLAAHVVETWVLTNQPPLAYLNKSTSEEPNGPFLAAIVGGNERLFAAVPFAAAPPAIIVGTGGDTLAKTHVAQLEKQFRATADARFGYVMFERSSERATFTPRPAGRAPKSKPASSAEPLAPLDTWSVVEHDPDGTIHRRCTLANRTIRC
jgi:hypothetical protein